MFHHHRLALMSLLLAVLMAFSGLSLASADDGITHQTDPVHVEDANQDTESPVDDLGDMSPIEMWELLSAVVLSGVIVPLVIRRGWDREQQRLVAFVCAFVTALVGSFFRGELDNFAFTATAILKLALLTHLTYEGIWKSKFLNLVPYTIEAKTKGDPVNPHHRLDGGASIN